MKKKRKMKESIAGLVYMTAVQDVKWKNGVEQHYRYLVIQDIDKHKIMKKITEQEK